MRLLHNTASISDLKQLPDRSTIGNDSKIEDKNVPKNKERRKLKIQLSASRGRDEECLRRYELQKSRHVFTKRLL